MRQLLAGAARIDITPLSPVPLAGYPPIRLYEGGPQDHLGYTGRVGASEGVHDPLYARALALESGGRCLVIVALDLCIVSLDLTRRIGAAAQARWGVDPDSIVLSPSHTHGGPDYTGYWEPVDPEVQAYIEEMTLTAIGQALARRQPAFAGWGIGALARPIVNRRDPSRPTDSTVSVLRVDDAAGATLAILFIYACHPIVVGSDNRLITADYPGYASGALEQSFGEATVALFMNGTAGNINPVAFPYSRGENISSRSKRFALERRPVEFRTHSEAKRLGLALAGEAMKVAAMVETAESCRIDYRKTGVSALRKQGDEFETYVRHDVLQPGIEAQLRSSDHVETEVMALRVGAKTILALPGEPFVEIGLDLQREAGVVNTDVLVVGYVNDYPGYVVTPSDYAENRYETIATPLAEPGATAIVEAARELKSSLIGVALA